MRIPARVDDEGRAIPKSRYGFDSALKLRGRDVWITDQNLAIRSDSANRYLWGVCYRVIAEDTGNDPQSIHDGFKREALRQGILNPDEVSVVDNEPTTVTDSDTFERYTQFVRHSALHDLGIVIPEPEAAA